MSEHLRPAPPARQTPTVRIPPLRRFIEWSFARRHGFASLAEFYQATEDRRRLLLRQLQAEAQRDG